MNLFTSQRGGGPISLFKGLPRYPSGEGFGDFFQGLLRLIIPIALSVCKSALSAMSEAQDQRSSFKDTLKSAVRPATKAAIHWSLSQIDREQQVSAPKRGRKHKAVYKCHIAKRSKQIIYNF